MYYFSLAGQQTTLQVLQLQGEQDLIDIEPTRLVNGELVAIWTPPVNYFVEYIHVMYGSKVVATHTVNQRLEKGQMLQIRHRFSIDTIGQHQYERPPTN